MKYRLMANQGRRQNNVREAPLLRVPPPEAEVLPKFLQRQPRQWFEKKNAPESERNKTKKQTKAQRVALAQRLWNEQGLRQMNVEQYLEKWRDIQRKRANAARKQGIKFKWPNQPGKVNAVIAVGETKKKLRAFLENAVQRYKVPNSVRTSNNIYQLTNAVLNYIHDSQTKSIQHLQNLFDIKNEDLGSDYKYATPEEKILRYREIAAALDTDFRRDFDRYASMNQSEKERFEAKFGHRPMYQQVLQQVKNNKEKLNDAWAPMRLYRKTMNWVRGLQPVIVQTGVIGRRTGTLLQPEQLKGWWFQKVPSDGNCMFNAVALAWWHMKHGKLLDDAQMKEVGKMMRTLAVEQIRVSKSNESLSSYFRINPKSLRLTPGTLEQRKQVYLDEMMKPGVYGQYPELVSLSKVLGVSFVVHQVRPKGYTRFAIGENGRRVHLFYDGSAKKLDEVENGHYDALLNTQGKRPPMERPNKNDFKTKLDDLRQNLNRRFASLNPSPSTAAVGTPPSDPENGGVNQPPRQNTPNANNGPRVQTSASTNGARPTSTPTAQANGRPNKNNPATRPSQSPFAQTGNGNARNTLEQLNAEGFAAAQPGAEEEVINVENDNDYDLELENNNGPKNGNKNRTQAVLNEQAPPKRAPTNGRRGINAFSNNNAFGGNGNNNDDFSIQKVWSGQSHTANIKNHEQSLATYTKSFINKFGRDHYAVSHASANKLPKVRLLAFLIILQKLFGEKNAMARASCAGNSTLNVLRSSDKLAGCINGSTLTLKGTQRRVRLHGRVANANKVYMASFNKVPMYARVLRISEEEEVVRMHRLSRLVVCNAIPNFPIVYGAIKCPDDYYVVLTEAFHGNLSQWFMTRRSPSEIASALAQCLVALAVLHGQRLTHGKLLPENIMFLRYPRHSNRWWQYRVGNRDLFVAQDGSLFALNNMSQTSFINANSDVQPNCEVINLIRIFKAFVPKTEKYRQIMKDLVSLAIREQTDAVMFIRNPTTISLLRQISSLAVATKASANNLDRFDVVPQGYTPFVGNGDCGRLDRLGRSLRKTKAGRFVRNQMARQGFRPPRGAGGGGGAFRSFDTNNFMRGMGQFLGFHR